MLYNVRNRRNEAQSMSKSDNDYVKICLFCENATLLRNNEGLCKYNGVVCEDHSCKKYVYDPLKRQPMQSKSMPPLSAEDIL